jgi:hypothetical protein
MNREKVTSALQGHSRHFRGTDSGNVQVSMSVDRKNTLLAITFPEFPMPLLFELHGKVWRSGVNGKRVSVDVAVDPDRTLAQTLAAREQESNR